MAQSFLEIIQKTLSVDQLEFTQPFCIAALQPKIQGKMYIHTYTILTILCLSSRYSSVEIRPELQRNILKFGYGINYKYEGMLAHYFDRFHLIAKFILPTLDDLKLSPIRYGKECKYI